VEIKNVAACIAQALHEASETLSNAGVPESRKEARTLLAYVLHVDRTVLITNSDELIAQSSLNRFQQLIDRRAIGEPAQYIIGAQDFYGRSFEVNPDVLIPRPETEWLIEAALPYLSSAESPFRICDVGTGSGCIAVTLLCENQLTQAIGLDISEPALKVARRNANAHNVANRISFIQSDCFSALSNNPIFDLIVSNPPYVSEKIFPGLQREVRDHEPKIALTPGEDGLTLIRRLINEALPFLKEKGHLLIEIGFDQSEAIPELIDPAAWLLVRIAPDLQQIPRIVVLEKLARPS
jgi:release factor glutamine methyltransferase